MATPIKIRPVRSGDWAKLETLVSGICRFHGDTHKLTREQFDNLAIGENAPMTVLVAETEHGILAGFVAGYAIYAFESGKTAFEIQNLFVAEEFRRQRIGEILMISIMQSARHKLGEVGFRLGSLDWNKAAIEFYKQMGFEPNLKHVNTVRLMKETA